MINVKDFFQIIKQNGISNFAGVPDSLLKSICAYITDNTSPSEHLITANEGSAIALAVGQYLATNKPSLVYMQNSGFGNSINPILSLADNKVYGIPMVIMVGWRGEPGVKDEPQHLKQGEVMESLLKSCQLEYVTLDKNSDNFAEIVEYAISRTVEKKHPIVILVKKGTFEPYNIKETIPDNSQLSREDAIREIVESSTDNSVFISTTGMASRELFEIRSSNNYSHDKDFLTVGSMGHANMIALGVSQNSDKQIICIDGDGASLMHMGNLTSIGQTKPANYIHVLLNNSAHDSVGGQPTCAAEISLTSIAKSCGYSSINTIQNKEDINKVISWANQHKGPHFIEIIIKKGARGDLGRPTSSPNENKNLFMKAIIKQ